MKESIKLILLLGALAFSCENNSDDTDYSSVVGLWTCEEIDEYANVRNYNIDIDNVVNYDNVFIISNFHNAGQHLFVRASVSDSILNISKQSIGNNIVEGIGVITPDNKQITLKYEVDAGSGTEYFYSMFLR